jgi:uncharacterized membrane protein YoaT (DUF817 family)
VRDPDERPIGHPGHYAPWLARAHQHVRRLLSGLPRGLSEFLIFGFKQAWASLFGGILLALIIATKLVWQEDWPLHRYDGLFIAAVAVQLAFIILKLEALEEAKIIFLFHVVGTLMELFKTHVGSWTYPEAAWLRIGHVPLFTGFMYASVGSYMVRAIRLFDMRFSNYPPFWMTAALAALIYVNFYSHHYLPDLRYVLFAAAFVLYGRCRIYFTVDEKRRWMPLLLACFLTSVFIWFGENIGTATGTWSYPSQHPWQWVSLAKMGSWFLLLIISFVLVTIIHPPQAPEATESPRGDPQAAPSLGEAQAPFAAAPVSARNAPIDPSRH